MGYVLAVAANAMANRLDLPRIPIIVCTDSYSLYDCLVKLGTTTEKRLMIDLMALRQSYEHREIEEVRWIRGPDNPADAMTKKAANATTTIAATTTSASIATKVIEEVEDVDSEVEVDALSTAVRLAQDRGIMGVPLAVPCDASSWFVARRERIRTCRELLANALLPPRPGAVGVPMGPGRL